ncbi:MAG: glutamine--fructose-6-phosphate aminotransferase [Elusimicrobia bacterium CG08_land_8_20_14_0_20_59_10]|nr:MAG: glutamine--fructose-6-phosphate aminotransferase [Elusimicrobia bacterium CG08_land_8_20_14_0_20_59_10]
MCGVIGLSCAKDREDLGEVASRLLRMLEYRGYDSTGALIQDASGRIFLKKDVGAPTVITKKLGIDKLSGKLFCGQVRWATFGVVNKENAQPHEVRCHTHLYGAHNGNITNCDQLKDWLLSAGHDVKSDNDGEMLVHTIEHFFAIELKKLRNTKDKKQRYGALKNAILAASKKTTGSFAAVVVDPVTELMACIKAGSSLYMGGGAQDGAGPFILVSSDLASVLSMTKMLYPIKEDEFALYSHEKADFFDLRTGRPIPKEKTRSHLRVEETELKKPFKYFMEQEIFGEVEAAGRVINYFADRSPVVDLARKVSARDPGFVKELKNKILALSAIADAGKFKKEAASFLASTTVRKALSFAGGFRPSLNTLPLESFLADLLEEVNGAGASAGSGQAVKFADAFFLLEEIEDIKARVAGFVESMAGCRKSGRTAYFVACGTSYNAAKCASVFFNKIAGVNVTAYLPGDFRAQCLEAVQDGDIIIGISQSGETKDLVDVFNQVKAAGKKVVRINIVNNVNSTIALEKSDIFIPLYCGPEIAVPATKSFINQLLVLYILALRLAEYFTRTRLKPAVKADLERYRENLYRIPELIGASIKATRDAVEQAAVDLFLEPSLHILATGMQGIAREGALKVREVVLNHTEGFEAPEFKHGPNTILGVNTIFGMEGVGALVDKFADSIKFAVGCGGKELKGESLYRIFRAVSDYAFFDLKPRELSREEGELFSSILRGHNFFESMYTNYPLMFITGPNSRDVNLTISQINTHKIRGANIYVIAEEDPLLRDAAKKSVPSMYSKTYKYGYITLPRTGDDLLVFFTSSVVLQVLALEMSVRKMKFLDRLEIRDHGVHPDSPKNVSKSITVD